MRKLCTLEEEELAEKLRWYLQSRGVDTAKGEASPGKGSIWVLLDEQLPQAEKLWEEFQEASQAQVDRAIKASKKKYEDEIAAAQREQVIAEVKSFEYPLTVVLIACSCVFYLFSLRDPGLYSYLTFSNNPWARLWELKRFDEIFQGEVWRLCTPIFIHQGFLHLLFNMYWLYILGRPLESEFSTRKLFFLTVLVAVVSHVAFYLVAGPAFGGMSGVIYGLYAYLWVVDSYGPRRYSLVDHSLGLFFYYWYILSLVLSLLGMNIANTIHGFGAIVGILFGVVDARLDVRFLLRNADVKKKLKIAGILLFFSFLIDHFKY